VTKDVETDLADLVLAGLAPALLSLGVAEPRVLALELRDATLDDRVDLRRALADVDLLFGDESPHGPVELADRADGPIVAVVRVAPVVESPRLARIPRH